MALTSERLRKCGVKISTFVCGVPSLGSGVVYETPNNLDYNYILTAKHIFQEDSQTSFDISDLAQISIFYSEKKKFHKLQTINKRELSQRLIIFEEDFLIIKVDKNENVRFPQILVADKLEDSDLGFFAWGTFSANTDELHNFNFKRNDSEIKRFKFIEPPIPESLPGMSGAGVFIDNKHILLGVICKYPNTKLANYTIDCSGITFETINKKLSFLNLVTLATESSSYKREINNSVVDIHQAVINDVCLDLELARVRLKTDLADDWFYDPLRYIDLLNQDYLFKQFKGYFDENKYKAARAERFYVPKKKFTLRQALISPFIDRIMYMAVVGVLADKLDNALIPNVYSARYNKFSKKQLIVNGVEQWKKMKYVLADNANLKDDSNKYIHNCVIKIDLLNFFDNISKKLLIEKIERICETPNEINACKLLDEMLHNLSIKELGLPQNSDASALLASFYLNQVDVFMHNSAPAYFRFMDDIRIFCEDKYEARRILQAFECELRRCHLSVNSQKTEIISIIDDREKINGNDMFRGDFDDLFNIELGMVSRLRKSDNYAYLNQAFHLSLKLLKDSIYRDPNGSDDSARKLNFALGTLELLGKKCFNIYSLKSDFIDTLLLSVKSLIDKPWMTTQVCKVLNLLSTNVINEIFLTHLKTIILNDKYNTYEHQTYQIWLLLAKHKCRSLDLIKYAVQSIEKNDETNRSVIASMIIYVCSVDSNYKRVIIRKFGEGFTHGYFQNRIALISLRSFKINIIPSGNIDSSLQKAPEFTNRFMNKDLVYVQGYDEDNDEENYIEQLYSI